MAEAQTETKYLIWWLSAEELKGLRVSELNKIESFPDWLVSQVKSAKRSKDGARIRWIHKNFKDVPNLRGALPRCNTNRTKGIVVTSNELTVLENLPGVLTQCTHPAVYSHFLYGDRA